MFITKKCSNLSRRPIIKSAVKVEVSEPVVKEEKKEVKKEAKIEEPAPKKGKAKKASLPVEETVAEKEDVKNNEE